MTEYVEETLHFSEVETYFKSLSLNIKVEAPFMTKSHGSKLWNMSVEKKEGYIAFFLGTYKIKSVRMENIKIFYARSLDDKIQESFGDSPFVTLSDDVCRLVFFFINRENLRDCRHEFKDSLPDSFADCQFVAAASHLAGEPRGTCLLSVLRSWQTGICQAPAES